MLNLSNLKVSLNILHLRESLNDHRKLTEVCVPAVDSGVFLFADLCQVNMLISRQEHAFILNLSLLHTPSP